MLLISLLKFKNVTNPFVGLLSYKSCICFCDSLNFYDKWPSLIFLSDTLYWSFALAIWPFLTLSTLCTCRYVTLGLRSQWLYFKLYAAHEPLVLICDDNERNAFFSTNLCTVVFNHLPFLIHCSFYYNICLIHGSSES